MSATIIETINPATGKVIAKYQNMDDDQVREKVRNSRLALHGWKNLDIGERCSIARNLGRVMRKNKDEYAKLITEEMGKPIRQAIAEVEKCAWLCDYYSETAET
ncbi:MAG: aldehyde dehydrogenase family protein, partial [Nitrososphaeraceae archaeon]